jgi:hypothetical protein
MKSLLLILTCLLIVTPCQSAEKQLIDEQQIEQRLKIQHDRLKDIQELVVKERKTIENWYAFHLAELRRLAERKAKQLIVSERMLWTEFIKMNNGTPHTDTYFKMNDQITYANSYFSKVAQTYKHVKKSGELPKQEGINLFDASTVRWGTSFAVVPRSYTRAFELRDALMDSYFLSTAANLLLDHEFCKLLTDLSNGSAYNPQNLLIRSEARKLLHLVNEFNTKLTNLQNRRNTKLAALEQWENDMRADVFRIISEIKTKPKTPELGVISVISCEEKDAVCMIDGVDGILKAGNTIGNIKIVKIQKGQVEFAKSGHRWVQAVGQPANPAWR